MFLVIIFTANIYIYIIIVYIINHILQLRKSAQDLKNCAENYQKLYQSAFDADPGSLTNIRAYPFIKFKAIFI